MHPNFSAIYSHYSGAGSSLCSLTPYAHECYLTMSPAPTVLVRCFIRAPSLIRAPLTVVTDDRHPFSALCSSFPTTREDLTLHMPLPPECSLTTCVAQHLLYSVRPRGTAFSSQATLNRYTQTVYHLCSLRKFMHFVWFQSGALLRRSCENSLRDFTF